jgi:hypothetical protein
MQLVDENKGSVTCALAQVKIKTSGIIKLISS